MKTSWTKLASRTAAAWLVSASAFAAPYTLTDLGANAYPLALNDSKVVVGTTAFPGPFQQGGYPFIWRGGILTQVSAPGWTGGDLAAINSSGVAVGQARLADPAAPTAPFVYDNGTVSLLAVPGIGAADAINDAGVIGGFVQSVQANGFGPNAPFLYQSGVVTILSNLGVDTGGVTGINTTGVAAGTLMTAPGLNQPFVWQNSAMSFLPALGNLPTVNGINDGGTIVGSTNIGSDPTSHVVIWSNGALTDLGALATGMTTTGLGINNGGVIVGTAYGLVGGVPLMQGFVYRAGAFQTLDSLMAGSGWQFAGASAINQHGDIAGFGYPPGATELHGVLLSVATPPTPAEMAADLATAITATGLGTPDAQALLTLLRSYQTAGGANQHALCVSLDRFVRKVPGMGLSAADASALIQQATDLASALGC